MTDASLWQKKAEALERVVSRLMEEEHRLAALLMRAVRTPRPAANGDGAHPASPATPAELHWAVATDDVDGLRMVLAKDGAVDLVASADARGRTALHRAVASGRSELVSMLIAHGAPVDARDADGNVPLHLAADAHAIGLLASARADMLARDGAGRTPLERARDDGRSFAARELKRRAACPPAELQRTEARAPPLPLEGGAAPCARVRCSSSAAILLLTLHDVAPCRISERSGVARALVDSRRHGELGAPSSGSLHVVMCWRGVRVLSRPLLGALIDGAPARWCGVHVEERFVLSCAPRCAMHLASTHASGASACAPAACALDAPQLRVGDGDVETGGGPCALDVWLVSAPSAASFDCDWAPPPSPPPSAAGGGWPSTQPQPTTGGALGGGWRLLARGTIGLERLAPVEPTRATCALCPLENPGHAADDDGGGGGGGGGDGGWSVSFAAQLLPLGARPTPPSTACARSNAPDGCTDAPDGCTDAPDGCTDAPDGCTDAPDGCTDTDEEADELGFKLDAAPCAAHERTPRQSGAEERAARVDTGAGGAEATPAGARAPRASTTGSSDVESGSLTCASTAGSSSAAQSVAGGGTDGAHALAARWRAAACAPAPLHARLAACRKLFRAGHAAAARARAASVPRSLGARVGGALLVALRWRARVDADGDGDDGAAHGGAGGALLVPPGIPLVHRPQLWWELSGAALLRDSEPAGAYEALCARSERRLHAACRRQIDADLRRTFSSHPLFAQPSAQPQGEERVAPTLSEALRRLLGCYCVRNPSVGYCQALNLVGGALLLIFAEDEAFWMLCALCERLLPDYFSSHMSGLLADRDVLLALLAARLPAVGRAFAAAGPCLPLSMVLARWLLPLFLASASAPTHALRLWDCLFFDGPAVLVSTAFSICEARAAELCAVEPQMLAVALARPPTVDEALRCLYTERGSKSALLKAARNARERAHARRLAAQLAELRGATRLRVSELERLVRRLRERLHAGAGATDVLVSTDAFVQLVREEAPECTLPPHLLHTMFDTDGDGQIDLRELLVGLALLRRGTGDELLRACFSAYDTDESGFLEKGELAALVARVYRFVLAEGEADGAAEAAGAAAVVTRDAFARFDANGDDRLSIDEFRAIVDGDFLLTSWFQLQATAVD
ncbi:hypothetical protein KFE25_000025 [Diacronema lutheri]|uniref:Calmodulin n=1 Tax=Diacronema lutheri TaxID=2081491 RepID=A0A8J5XH35_DIALT|nr:hypothetical protein KFE25_000025 [Diacronema lutheri]